MSYQTHSLYPSSVLFASVLIPQANNWQGNATSLFTYTIPGEIADSIVEGQSVLVPFGNRLTLGIIWRSSTAQDMATLHLKPIHYILDPIPLLDTIHRQLAEWLATTYVCSLVDAVRLIAPGMTTAPRIDLIVAPAEVDASKNVLPGDDPAMSALLGLLHQRGNLDEQVVRRALGTRKAGDVIAQLEERGALVRTLHQNQSAPMPDDELRLVALPDEVSQWRSAIQQQLQPQPVMRINTRPSPLKTNVAARKRQKGNFLREIGQPTEQITYATSLPLQISTREAIRLRAALAIIDLLQASSSATRPRREVLRLTRATPAALQALLATGMVTQSTTLPKDNQSAGALPAPAHELNEAQRLALDSIIVAMDAALERMLLPPGEDVPDDLAIACRPILLHGVTGSGKTEVYLQALTAAVECGRRGIVLVPEIALTPQTVSRFASRFPGRVALLHSALKPHERQREWQRIRSGAVDVVIGSRSAIFAPIPDLGLIILDEEHDASYKHEQRPPTYHAREVAIALAQLTGAAAVFGSATPATETYARAQSGEFALVVLPERAVNVEGKDSEPSQLPPVTIVDLRDELHAGHTSILSRELLSAMAETVARGEQVILYLNRRGSSTCVLCRDCGYVMRCGRCDVPLTHHQRQAALICHHCNWHEPPPQRCLQCGSSGMRYFGIGTERVEATVRERFPTARVLRWDADTIKAYTDHERYGRALAQRQVDILIGTQMIAKGLDVPSVTLVGIVAADVALYLPDYRASERAFQLLTQVAGRAGRGTSPGRVIMQTFSPDHFCIEAAAHHDYASFYATEISARQAYGYPPFRRFVKLTYTHKDRYSCQVEALAMGDQLTRMIHEMELAETDIVGPAPAFIERLRAMYRWQLLIRGPDPRVLIAALEQNALGSGWSIDIDPLSSL